MEGSPKAPAGDFHPWLHLLMQVTRHQSNFLHSDGESATLQAVSRMAADGPCNQQQQQEESNTSRELMRGGVLHGNSFVNVHPSWVHDRNLQKLLAKGSAQRMSMCHTACRVGSTVLPNADAWCKKF